MDSEIKRIETSWNEKSGSIDVHSIYSNLYEMDQALLNCKSYLSEVSLDIDYVSKSAEMETYFSDHRLKLTDYIDCLWYRVEDNLDKPLRDDFYDNATETISNIQMENFEVDNTIGGITTTSQIPTYYIDSSTGTVISTGVDSYTGNKEKLTFNDFIGVNDGKTDQILFETRTQNGKVISFAEIFSQQYQAYVDLGVIDESISENQFLEVLYSQGEFDHYNESPFASFVSSALDFTIIKPLYEAATGQDVITGQHLSETERYMKVVFATLDIISLGQSVLAEEALKQGGKGIAKAIAVEIATNASASITAALCDELDVPFPIAMLLTMGAGLTVSHIGNKICFTDSNGKLLKTVDADPDLIKVIDDEIIRQMGGNIPDEILSVLQKEGLSIDDFNMLRLRDVSTLSNEEIMLMKRIRDNIPMPDSNTMMQKVIPAGDIEKYMDGTYTSVGGFVTRADDVSQLKSYDDIFQSLRLDYTDTQYKPDVDESLAVIRYTTSEPSKIEIPYKPEFGGSVNDLPPFTGNGFTSATNGQVIPEYKCSGYTKLNDGAQLIEIGKDGSEKLLAVFDEDLGKFVPVD